MYMVIKMGRRQARLFASAHGEEHLEERTHAIERMADIREDYPEFFASSIIAETWGRMTFQYSLCGWWDTLHSRPIRWRRRFRKIKRFAIAPKLHGWAAWNLAPVFDFDIPDGSRQMVILPEIQQERRRRDIQAREGARAKAHSPAWLGKKEIRTRNGPGETDGNIHIGRTDMEEKRRAHSIQQGRL